MIATAYLARSAEVVAEAADVVGDRRGQRYADLADGSGRPSPRSTSPRGPGAVRRTTDYALALEWACCRPRAADGAGERLADLVRTSGYRISTGFVGTPLIATRSPTTGHADLAYRLLLQTAARRGCTR